MAAYTTIDDPAEYFVTVLYTGNGASTPGGSGSVQTVSGLDFAPNLVWIKDRSADGHNHNLMDTVRGAPNILMSDVTTAEITNSDDALTSFTSDGFVIGDNGEGTQSLELNKSGNTFVAWCWKESATAGFDIVGYTGDGSAGTISHSLSAVPDVIISMNRPDVENKRMYHSANTSEPETEGLNLGGTNATDDDAGYWNDTAPTSSVFTVGTNGGTNGDGDAMIAYLWTSKQGFSKLGGYIGNGNADGTFVYTGFRPAYVMLKRTSAAGDDFVVLDNKRIGYNIANYRVFANDSRDEETSDYIDFLSNGFKLRSSGNDNNGSGSTYIYMAFAEAPFVNSNGVPCNAR